MLANICILIKRNVVSHCSRWG